jgi:hypothetical protein
VHDTRLNFTTFGKYLAPAARSADYEHERVTLYDILYA